jgi:hypothetical protein
MFRVVRRRIVETTALMLARGTNSGRFTAGADGADPEAVGGAHGIEAIHLLPLWYYWSFTATLADSPASLTAVIQ